MCDQTEIWPEQVKAARALLRLEQDELARRARVSVTTIRRLESVDGDSLVTVETVQVVHQVLRDAGVEFIPDGVRRTGRLPDPTLLADLHAIGARSEALQAAQPQWTEDDLYGQNGLPA